MIIWLIGLSGAGKTIIARRLVERLKEDHKNLVFLDGDVLRDVWGDSLGHDIEGRRVNAHRISHLCRMLDRQDIHVVAAVLSIFPDWQAWNRETFSRYFEVLIDAPMEVLKARDSKGLYAKALAGEITNVVGVDIPFPTPSQPDLVIDNSTAREDPGELSAQIFAALPPLEGR